MAQPATADARISCPVCRAPVHPIAGRCKHCRADLVRVRGGTTGAGETPVSMPTMGPGGAPAAAPPPLPGGRGGLAMPALGPRVASGAPASASPPAGSAYAPSTAAAGERGAAPVPVPGQASAAPWSAPPLATVPAPRARARHWSHRWPLAVAVLAALAIVASLVVLVLGDRKPAARTLRPLGPAPERMDTDVGPPPSVPRPSPPPTPQPSLPDPGAQPPSDPADGPAVVPPADPADPADPRDPFDPQAAPGAGSSADPADPFAAPTPPRAPGAVPDVRDPGEFLTAAIDLGCERLMSCTGSSTVAQSACAQVRKMAAGGAGPVFALSCTRFDAVAARACLGAIVRMPCPGSGGIDVAQLARLASGIPACARICGP